MAATDFHSKGGEVQGDAWEIDSSVSAKDTTRSKAS
jgi:hypothetical protein